MEEIKFVNAQAVKTISGSEHCSVNICLVEFSSGCIKRSRSETEHRETNTTLELYRYYKYR